MSTSISSPPNMQSPVYMSYLHSENHPAVNHQKHGTSTRPYQPSSNLSYVELDMEGAKGIYEHFHSPQSGNQHNRFMAGATKADIEASTLHRERMPPPPFDQSGRPSIRPASAPGTRRTTQHAQGTGNFVYTPEEEHRVQKSLKRAGYGTGAQMTMTGTVPVFTAPALVEADLEEGSLLDYSKTTLLQQSEQPWRVATVETYVVPPHPLGFASGGSRPFHQDYRHYKYFGFGGRGARTSWAFNPKYHEDYTRESREEALLAAGTGSSVSPPPVPLRETLDGPRRPLTEGEKALVREFRSHSHSLEGTPSSDPRKIRGSPLKGGQSPSPQRSPFAQQASARVTQTDILEPYMEHVDLESRKKMSPEAKWDTSKNARVTTYRSPTPGDYSLTENTSPQHGSQSPFTARYAHYKQYGFAGKGATSSWARNPKNALI